MTMSLGLIGGLVGLAFAVVEYGVFGALITRAMRNGETGPGPRIFDIVRKIQLVAFPAAGVIVGLALEGAGVFDG